jgi:hypothetical protein
MSPANRWNERIADPLFSVDSGEPSDFTVGAAAPASPGKCGPPRP